MKQRDILKAHQKPMRLPKTGKRDIRTQFGVLPYRVRDGKLEIMLITSRGTGRWIIPKGWPMDRQTPAGAAAQEAWEEAGIGGKLYHSVLGFYTYVKRRDGQRMPIVVAVFPLKVKKEFSNWPERRERERRWMSRKEAAGAVDEPELAEIIQRLDPRRL